MEIIIGYGSQASEELERLDSAAVGKDDIRAGLEMLAPMTASTLDHVVGAELELCDDLKVTVTGVRLSEDSDNAVVEVKVAGLDLTTTRLQPDIWLVTRATPAPVVTRRQVDNTDGEKTCSNC